MSAEQQRAEYSRCPICDRPLRQTGIRAYDRLATGDGPFTIVQCDVCQYGATVPQLSDEEVSPYYSSTYYEDYCDFSGEGGGSLLHRMRGWFRRWSTSRRYRKAPYTLGNVAPGRMLDVGCGAGDLLEHFAFQGWDTYGIDPSSSGVATAARRGAKVHRGTVADQPWQDGWFQLVAFQHSLEHVGDPIAALRHARALMAADGLLVIVVPNWACWQRRLLFRDRWAHLDLPRHQHHFSPRALTELARVLDLRVQEVGTSSTVISAAYSLHFMIAGRWTPGWKLWLSYALGLLVLPAMLLGDRLLGGDCCFIVMRKTSREASSTHDLTNDQHVGHAE